MPAPSLAHLLLPTPLGLVHYDLLEEAAFLGFDARGRFTASPTPFREAKLALTADAGGFVVRALPGEAPADVNGAPADGARLADGDRIRLGDQVAQYRAPVAVARPAAMRAAPVVSGLGVVAVPAGADPAEALGTTTTTRRSGPPPRPQVPRGARNAALALKLLGAGAVVLAVYQAVRFLDAPGAAPTPPVTSDMLPDEPQPSSHPEEKGSKAYEAAREVEATDLPGAVDRLRAVVKDFPGTIAAQRANARIAEVYPMLAAKEWRPVEDALQSFSNAQKFRHALDLLADYERRFAGTEPAAKVPAKMESLRAAARAALDAVERRVAPHLPKDPRRAYQVLVTSDLELPPDLEVELAGLMAQVRALFPKTGPRPPPGEGPGGALPPPPPPPTKRKPGRELMPPGGGKPTPDDGGDDAAGGGSASAPREEEARVAFDRAKADLDAKNWEAARKEFTTLSKSYGDTNLVAGRMERIRAGRKAADVGQRGAAALLKGDADVKNGRLEVEYEFEDDVAFLQDFALEQPFASEDPLAANVRSGMVVLSGSTAMLNKVVFDPTDVSWEMECVADRHEDYGLFGLQESKDYRSVVLDVGNTQFKLKKGDAAKVLSGHVLWLFGEGVWKDADPGERGFVRIAERPGNKLVGGERIKVRIDIKGGQVAAEIHGKGEAIELKGALKGDDGRGLSALRVGAFAFKGRVGVDRLKISGKPDPAWLDKEFQALLKAVDGK